MIRTTMNAIALGVALAGSVAPLAAHAEGTATIEKAKAATYLNGGIGKDERAVMTRESTQFPLRMTFSERKDGELIADVPVVVSDAKGNQVFMLPEAGPLLYVMLPDGKYTVRATWNGKTQTREVTIAGKPGHDLYFHWAGEPARG